MSLPLWLFHTKGRILRGELFEVESIWRLRCHDLEPGVVVHTCSLRRGNSRIRSSRTALVFHIDSEINLVSHENSLKNINMSIVPYPHPSDILRSWFIQTLISLVSYVMNIGADSSKDVMGCLSSYSRHRVLLLFSLLELNSQRTVWRLGLLDYWMCLRCGSQPHLVKALEASLSLLIC